MLDPTMKLEDDRLVISLDFGTTYSGVAYAFNIPGKKADVVSILDWPGNEGRREPKVPTLILYDELDSSKFKWGAQVSWRDPAVHGVKLLLDPDQARPSYLPVASFKRDRLALPKDPTDVAADFIGAIYKHALNIIEAAGVRDYFKYCQKDFMLTVPAVWSDKAMDLTLKAAKKAGIHPVTLIKEPEAAALYTLTSHDHSIKPGDSFVVCDAGGGTVDLITYEVKKISPYLELAELVPGTGGMVGSLVLNKLFEDTVRLVVGDEQFVNLKKTIGWAKAINEFDKNIKTAFDGDVTDVHYVNFPKAELQDDLTEGLVNNCWEMTGDVLQDIFKPILGDVLRLVDSQVKDALQKQCGNKPKGIFLVGGFGSSRYLKNRLQQVYEAQGIQVIQPHDAWGAIVNGAVLSRLANQAGVASTKAVCHYGVVAANPYNALADRGRPIIFMLGDDTEKVRKVTWYVYKGDDLKRDQPIRFPFFRTVKECHTREDLVFHDDLVWSDRIVAPTYPGPEIKTCCTLRADLGGVSRKKIRKKFIRRTGSDGKLYYDIHYHLVLSTAHANFKFSLEVDGQEMGSIEASYI